MVFKHSQLETVIQTLFIKLCYQAYILFLGLTVFSVCLNSLTKPALSYSGLGAHWVESGTFFVKLRYQKYIFWGAYCFQCLFELSN